MKNFYSLFTILFFTLSFNISAQETVIAVWDFVDGSTVGVNGDGFTTTGGNSLGWLKNGDQSGVSDPNSVVCAGKSGFSANFIQNLDITSTDLVGGKLHVSMTFNNIDLTAAADGTASIMAFWMKGAGNTTGNFGNNHRMAGLKLTHDAAGEGDIKVESLVLNNGVQYGGQKDVGGLGNTAIYNGQITIGTTMDFTNFTSSFWVGSPGEFPNTPFGLTTGTSAANQSTAWNAATQTMSPNALLKFLQFQTISGLGSVEVDQFKVSTGTYENTVAEGDAPPAPTSALMIQGVLDIDGGNKKAVHVRATEDIADLSIYKLKVYANANTTSSASYTFSGTASAGDDILIANDGDALEAYMSASTIFDSVDNTGGFPSINGDDSIELLMNDLPVEVYGEIGVDGNAANPSEVWEYTDSWAYKVDGAWTYGGINCTDGSTTTWDSSCVYPLAIGQEPAQPLLITTSVCATATEVRLTGPFWGWDPAGGPIASDNGDGTWTFTFDPAPTADMEYLLIVDGVQENLIANMANGGDCAPVTDYANYANRIWLTTAADVTNNYGQCGASCVVPVITMTGSDSTITVGDVYTDAGATASDDEEGDITANIIVVSTVDTTTAGTYTVTYNVSDGALNAATEVVRAVTVEAALPPNDSDSEQFCASGTDALPTTITLTPDDLTVNGGANLLSVSVTSGTIGSATWVGNWYDANLTVTGGVSDGVTATGLAAMAGLDITGFTSVTMTSVDLDAYADTVEMCLNLSVTWELPTVSGDEAICASGTDAAPTTITLTPDDLTVNEGQEVTAVSVTSGTIGSATWVGNWYNANLTVTGGVSDGVTATGLAAMAGLDITGFTSVTMTSVDLDAYADTVEMCLNLSVTYLEPSCVTPTDLTVSGITTTGAVVSWVSDGTQFMIELQPAGSAQGTDGGYVIGDVDAYTATSVDLTGFLTQNTSYSVYVINVCGDVMSSWSDPVSFTTLPAPIVPDYMNDFATYPGDLWTEAQGSPITGLTADETTSLWVADGFANNGFSGAARLNIYSTGRDEWLISPVFDLSAMNYFLNLDAAATEYGSSTLDAIWGSDDFAGLYVTTDGGATWTELYLWDGTNNPGAQGTIMPEIELSGYSTVQFGIYGESTALNEDIDFFVDNFSITAESQAPSCVAPTNLTVSGITTTGAVVSWVSDGTQFMIELQPAGSAQGTAGGYVIGDIEAYTATSVDLTGFLTPNTSYSVYVVNVCDSSNSEYTGPSTFTTPNLASCGETVVYTQVASGDYNVILTGGNPASVTISGDLEQSSFSDTCYDNIYVYDGAGTLLNAGNTCGVFTDVTYESTDGTISVNITNDSSVQNGDVSLAFSCVPPDTSAPVITLNGADSVDLFFGDTYTDAGASASDDVDGDLTSSIVVAGVVDVLTVGTYTVTYNVSDAAGNAATEVTRTVNVTIDSVRSILTFEEYPVTGDTWYGDAGQVTSIVADPDTSGGDHGNVGKMELAAAGEPWQNSQLNLVADTYAVNLLDGTAKRIIFDMWSETATCGLLKLEQEINGGDTVEHSFNVSGNGWETIVVDFTNGASNNGAAVNGEFNKIVLFFNYCDDAGNPIGTAPDVRYVDNISYLQGTLNEPPFNPGPAPIPTQLEENVVSVYSDTYSNNIATNLNPGWGQATAQSEFQLAEGDTALLYSNLNYQGLLYTSTDVTTMDYVHLDYYTDDSTALGFYVIQEGTGENGYSIDTELGITTGQWVSVDIPLSHYTVTDLSGVNQIKTDGNGTVYLDNIYFYTEPTAGLEDAELSQFTYFPNPVNNMLTIKAQASIDSITVYNMLGQSVIRTTPNTNDTALDMSELQTGAYFVQVSINNTLKTVRVIKN